jgi:hypothetical protein
MSKGLPPEYVSQYIHQYVGYVKEKKNGSLNGGCPICHEGDSWGRKSRFHYHPEREGDGNTTHCFNCGYSNNSLGFIADVSGMSFREIHKESEEYDIIPKHLDNTYEHVEKREETPPLPENSINIFDKTQLEFYQNNDIVRLAVKYIVERKILTAPNKPKALYVSLDDYTHKNRLIIPYYDNGRLVWYQSRKLLDDDTPKYLSKTNSERTLFNIDNIDPDIPYIFMFEGAIDSMFVKNATCLSGITEDGDFTMTNTQKIQLMRYPFHKIVWVIDSPYHDKAARNKTSSLFNKGEMVFQWPEALGNKCKDFNEIITGSSKKEITHSFIMRNIMEEEPNYMRLTIDGLGDIVRNNLIG